MEQIVDAHYFMLPTQGNIYSLSVLNLTSGVNKFIVASLKKKVFSFEYWENSEGLLKPIVKEISCTYIPSGAEIISVDAFNKSDTYDDFHIGIAIAKLSAEGNPETYLNIYSEQDLDPKCPLNIESLAQNCLMVELNFIPYHLTHTTLLDQSKSSESPSKGTVWLLSGSDCKIHAYQEDNTNHSYNEADINELFPELTTVPSVVMWIEVHYMHNFTRRLSVIGCECGTVQLSIVNTQSNTVISTHTDVFDGPISQAIIFSIFPEKIQPPDYFQTIGVDDSEESSSLDYHESSRDEVHLLVCNSLQASVVYMNIEQDGLSNRHNLDGSDLHDACLCACAADVNMDGYNEILLGTYGQKILMYQWSGIKWELCSQRSTANPVHGLRYVDLIGDGVNELIVQTLSGIHIMQHEPNHVQRILLSRIRRLLGEEEDIPDPVEIAEDKPSSSEDDFRCEEAREPSD